MSVPPWTARNIHGAPPPPGSFSLSGPAPCAHSVTPYTSAVVRTPPAARSLRTDRRRYADREKNDPMKKLCGYGECAWIREARGAGRRTDRSSRMLYTVGRPKPSTGVDSVIATTKAQMSGCWNYIISRMPYLGLPIIKTTIIRCTIEKKIRYVP